MSLDRLIRDLKRTDLIITPALSSWLISNDELTLKRDIADWVRDQLVTPPRNRVGSFSASARGSCQRAQALQYHGYESLPTANIGMSTIYIDGVWRHLRWQATLTMLGLLTDVEYPLQNEALRLKGTMDGLHMAHHYGWELKGMNTYIYNTYVNKKGGEMMPKHKLQVATYFLLVPTLERFSVIYEDKNTHVWHEFVVTRDDVPMQEAEDEILALNNHIDNNTLPEVLDGCKEVPNSDCSYRGECHAAKGGGGTAVAVPTRRSAVDRRRAQRAGRVQARPPRSSAS